MSDKQFLTTDIFKAWLNATEAQRAEEEARLKAVIIDRVLSDVVSRVRWGLTVQAAGDEVWLARGKRENAYVRQIVEDALEEIGWVRSNGGEL